MASWREFLEETGYEKLTDAKTLTEISAKDDPEEDPYRSLYKAREKYKEVQKVLKKWADKRKVEEDLKFIAAALDLRLGENFVSCEEKATGEEHLQRCLERVDDYKLTKDGAGIYQDVMNQLGILAAGRHKPVEAVEFFQKSEALYHDYKDIVGGAPMSTDEWLEKPGENSDELESKRSKKLEDNYTHTLYYFAQVYQALGEFGISGQYCHATLQRQLDSNDYDPLDWALSCATLSQYYVSERDFNTARHCIASADQIFEQAEGKIDESSADMKEKIQQGKADIQRCWVKYCLNLMEHSREELLIEATRTTEAGDDNTEADSTSRQTTSTEDTTLPGMSAHSNSDSNDDQNTGTSEGQGQTTATESQETIQDSVENQDAQDQNKESSETNVNINTTHEENTVSNTESIEKQAVEETQPENESVDANQNDSENQEKKAPVYEKPKMKIEPRFNLEVTSREEEITDKPFKTFDEARVIFLKVKKLIENTKEFYKFKEHCPDYVSIVQDHSISFKQLAFFELDLERQCKMHKRRIDMLTEVLKELSVQHYLLICRQLMFEIADTYTAMMDLKLAMIEAGGGNNAPNPHRLKKISTLAKESIKYFQEYLNTLKGGKPVYPNEFPENDVRPGLIAMFNIGRLHSKIWTGDIQGRLLNMKRSKDCYQFIVDYCKRNPSAVKLMEAELEICKELVVLLPKKMEKVRGESEM